MLPIAAARARQPLSLRPLLLARAAQPRLLARVAPLHITARLADARLRLPMRPLPPLSRPLPACFQVSDSHQPVSQTVVQAADTLARAPSLTGAASRTPAAPACQSTAAESEPVKHVRTGAAPNEVTEHELEVPTESAPVEGPMENPDFHKGTVWFENIFPFKLGVIDPRTYFINQYASKFVEEERWRSLVPEHFPEGAEFQFRSAEPNIKEGGLYLKFRYRGGTVEEAVEAIQAHVRDTGVRSSFNLRKIKAFEVKVIRVPWRAVACHGAACLEEPAG
nr:hypothetical protein HK105_006742 [Polyrhizophydium stewartii]